MKQRTCTADGCTNPPKARGLCRRHYSRWQRHGHIEPTRAGMIFDECFAPGLPDECWPWQGSFNKYGYGRFGTKMAHRLVFERLRGSIPDGLQLDHLCRNKSCVNPAHLEPVEQQENLNRGTRGYHATLRTTCRAGLHDITSPSSWYVNSAGHRTCLECKRENDRRAEAKRRPRVRR